MFSIKKYFFSIIIFVFTICLIIFSSSNLVAAKAGLNLWATSVVPSLFPFFVATELLVNTHIPYILGKLLNNIMQPIFNVSGEGSFAFIMGIISGYPTGAKIACDFLEKNILTKEECERLLSFTNNSGPLFIIGTVGINMFGNSTIGLLLFITHLLSCVTVGFIFRFWKINHSLNKTLKSNSCKTKEINLSNLGEIISDSIYKSIYTIMMIGGFVVLFSVIISIFKASKFLNMLVSFISPCLKAIGIPPTFIAPFITGIIEITNGIALMSNIHIKAISINIILTSFLLGFGGISIFLQVYSIVSKKDLSIKPYIIGKILQALFSAIYTFIFIQVLPIFNFNL